MDKLHDVRYETLVRCRGVVGGRYWFAAPYLSTNICGVQRDHQSQIYDCVASCLSSAALGLAISGATPRTLSATIPPPVEVSGNDRLREDEPTSAYF